MLHFVQDSVWELDWHGCEKYTQCYRCADGWSYCCKRSSALQRWWDCLKRQVGHCLFYNSVFIWSLAGSWTEQRSLLSWQVSVVCWIQSSFVAAHCSQTSRGHTAHQALQCLVPHRSVTRSPSRPEFEAMSRPPSEQVAWPTPQGQQLISCWPLQASCRTWTLGSDTTVPDSCALAMTNAVCK